MSTQHSIAEIDLHCHILPDWDDGPKDVEASLRLAAKASAAGIKKLLVTPHVGRSFGKKTEHPSSDIAAATVQLQAHIKSAKIDIELIPSAELTLSAVDFVNRVVAEPWLTFGGKRRYVLMESPFHFWPEWADQIVFELSLQNITPIIAHPERLSDVQKDINIIRQVVGRGALLQMTARSLVTSQREVKKCSQQLLEEGLITLVASDAHSSRHLMIAEVESEITAIVGAASARQILVENPRAILTGDIVLPPAFEAPRRQNRLIHFFTNGFRKP